MAPIYIGNKKIDKVFVGGKEIKSVYVGDKLVFSSVTIDPDAQAFLTATGIVDATITDAINNLVIGLKNNGLWTKMIAIYPFVGGTAETNKWNLKDPRDLDQAYRLAFFGGVTHSNHGVQGNGSDGYGITFFAPGYINSFEGQSAFYYVNQVGNRGVDFGCFTGTTGFQSNIYNSLNNFASRLNQDNVGSIVGDNSTGFYGISRTNNSNYNHNNNGAKTVINEPRTANVFTIVYLFGLNNAGSLVFPSDRRYGSFYIPKGLSFLEQDNLQTLDLAFQTALSRNV